MDYKETIRKLVYSKENHFSGDTYQLGRKKSLNRIEMMLCLTKSQGIPLDKAEESIKYLDLLVERKSEEDNIRNNNNSKPDMGTWRDGESFPEFTSPIDLAVMLFNTLDVGTSGVLKYSQEKGVPKWISKVNPGIVPTDRVKEHDVRAGLAEELRRYRMERSDLEKECKHNITVDEVLICRDSVTSFIRKKSREHIIQDLKFDKSVRKEGMQNLKKFLTQYATPSKSDDCDKMHNLHITMICHWIWQVKRRLMGKPTVYEIALIFLGRQGIGKSYTTRQIINVVEDLATPTNVANLVDERETRRWENYYIAFLDEISKETKDSLAKLKDWVTKSEAEFRPLYSNSSEACDKNAQAIGTSNFPLTSILKDPTGMRRFWEIPSEQPQNVLFENMDSVNWEMIYKSVDEDKEFGYYGPEGIGACYYKDIVNIQNSARDKSPIEEYLYINNYVDIQGTVKDSIPKEWVDVNQLKEEFNIWSEMNAWGAYTPKAFRTELLTMHLELKRKTGNILYVEVNVPEKMKPENQISEEVGFNE